MKKFFQNISLTIVFLFIYLLLFDLVARAFIKHSDKCYGILFNMELPPFKINTRGVKPLGNYDQWCQEILVGGKKITRGDLWGILAEDRVLGYAPKKNAASVNSWWQSNNLGARTGKDTPKDISAGTERVIVFGESLTGCSDVPMEATWEHFFNIRDKNVKFINFGVTGYSMGQCLLRYEALKDKLDYDMVLFVFSPRIDLDRDVNVFRQFLHWDNYPLLPRFVVENNKLKLIESPYRTWDDFFKDNAEDCSPLLRNHLRLYDRFYFKCLYESDSLISKSILYKLLATGFSAFHKKNSIYGRMLPGSEAMTISRKIFETVNEESRRDGKKFVLVLLPDSYKKGAMVYKNNFLFRWEYDALVASIRKEGITCIDLMQDFIKMEPWQFDTGYDGSHYGPRSNKVISDLVWKKLEGLKLLPPCIKIKITPNNNA